MILCTVDNMGELPMQLSIQGEFTELSSVNYNTDAPHGCNIFISLTPNLQAQTILSVSEQMWEIIII